MGLDKRIILAVVILVSILLAPQKQNSLAQSNPNYYRFTDFPAGNVCNFPGGLFPWDVTGNTPITTESHLDPENFMYFYVSAPGFWWRNWGAWNIYGQYGAGVTTFPDFPAYSIGQDDTLLIEVELYPERLAYQYPNSYAIQYLPIGDIEYYSYIVVECATGTIIDSGETFYD